MRTQVGIVGAGPAGLLLSHLLHLEGIDSVVLESRSRDYVEHRVRAGVLEQAPVDLLIETGVGERLKREGLVHRGIELRFDGAAHRIDITGLTGRSIFVYGQQEVVKDLVTARLNANGTILFETSNLMLQGIDSAATQIHFMHAGKPVELRCDFIAGCDGFHGQCRDAIPSGVVKRFERVYPFWWLSILAEAAPGRDELIYAYHERGFALLSMRSPEVSRLHMQVPPDTSLSEWPDDRIWAELRTRIEIDNGWHLNEGPIIERSTVPMRSFVAEPMQYGRLFIAGDAAHIVPPTGAKGMNLAVADVRVLARALAAFFRNGDETQLSGYSRACLKRVWRAEHFSWWMTSMLHRFPGDDPFQHRLQQSQMAYTVSSIAAAKSLAENYAGMPFEWSDE